MIRSKFFLAIISIFSFSSIAQATIIEDLIGEVKLAPINIDLDNPDAATTIDGILHIAGSHEGRAAVQRVDLATGTVEAIQFFDSLASASSTTGDNRGVIKDVTQLTTGEIIYAGHSAGSISIGQPTSWLESNAPVGGVGPTGQPESGAYVSVSNTGVMVGSVQSAIQGTHGNLPSLLPGGENADIAVDITSDGSFIAGDFLWNRNQIGGYDVLDTSNFDFSVSGGTPTWEAVAIDPVVDDAIFAGTYFNLNTFTNQVGFWRANGTFLFNAVSSSEFRDFEIYEGELVAAVTNSEDSFLYSISDSSSIALEEMLGIKSLIFDDGLFIGSAGFLTSTASGAIITSRFVNDGGPGGNPVPEPATCLLLASALGLGLKKKLTS